MEILIDTRGIFKPVEGWKCGKAGWCFYTACSRVKTGGGGGGMRERERGAPIISSHR